MNKKDPNSGAELNNDTIFLSGLRVPIQMQSLGISVVG